MSATPTLSSGEISTLIPARLERLPWGRFHVLVIVALGITWILDGLEVTLAGSVAPALKDSPALHFSDSEVGLAGSAYLLGAVVGALFFGNWETRRAPRANARARHTEASRRAGRAGLARRQAYR